MEVDIPGYGNCQQIDQGGFATVFEGFDENNDCRRVAIKRISLCTLRNEDDEKKAQRFIRNERDIHGRLHHPSIVEKLNSFPDGNFYYLVMEFCEKNLDSLILASGPLQEGLARHLFYQIILGVQYLHNQGIIHRDLKPRNILLKSENGKWSAKIADFGLATRTNGELHRRYAGTRAYMAPEILARKEYGREVDLWSLGILLYYMLTGRIPHDIRNDDMETEVIYYVDPGFSLVKSYSARNLITMMLREDPKERLPLERILRHEWFASEDLALGVQVSADSGHGVSLPFSKSSVSSSPRNISTSSSSARKAALQPINESGFHEESSPFKERSAVRKKIAAPKSAKENRCSLIQINTDGLKPLRLDDLPFVGSILENGEAVLEFLTEDSRRSRVKRVEEVIRISRDGSMMYIYSPGNPVLGNKPPPLPDQPEEYYFDQLGRNHPAREKYSLAARFVDMVKSKTYKVLAVFESESTGRAKCYLMRNEPKPNIETNFVEKGLKIIHAVNRVLIKSTSDQKFTKYPLNRFTNNPPNIPPDIQLFWEHHCTYREIVLDGDQFLCEQEKKAVRMLNGIGSQTASPSVEILSLRRSTDRCQESNGITASAKSGNSTRLSQTRTNRTPVRHAYNKSSQGTGYEQTPESQRSHGYESQERISHSWRNQSLESRQSYDDVMTQSEPQWNRLSSDRLSRKNSLR